MPKHTASRLAADESVGSHELEAAIVYLNGKIRDAAASNDPAPFLAYRNKMIFEATLDLREQRQTSL